MPWRPILEVARLHQEPHRDESAITAPTHTTNTTESQRSASVETSQLTERSIRMLWDAVIRERVMLVLESAIRPSGLTAEELDNLQTRPIAQSDAGEEGKIEDCCICACEMEVDMVVTVLPCEHWFHTECVRTWLGEHRSCPMCRSKL
ncbi:E3 ubiquitin-protein ligase dzip3 [Elasticomyces elasticus]|nr:E3 ubiquitin-protein ligase dzip3 [Elasticomyces elasticus]